MRTGTLKANGLRVASINVDFTVPGGKMDAKAAFVNTTTGFTHGWTTHQVWSPETLQKLKELRESMELDLADAHMLDTGEAPQSVVADREVDHQGGGLAEHLGRGGEDAEPI